jgi:hypothetical protein
MQNRPLKPPKKRFEVAVVNKRVVVEVSEEAHYELKKLAVLNDIKIYVLADAILEQCLSDEAQIKLLLKKLKE